MSLMQMFQQLKSSAAPPTVQNYEPGWAEGSGASISFNSDGRVSQTDYDGNFNYTTNWYTPTTAGIGSSYWIKVHLNSGAISYGTSGLTADTWTLLNPLRSMEGQTWPSSNVSYEISSSSSGSPVVRQGTIILGSD